MGKYHPHGDQSIYDTMVRMAQEFSLRYPLVDGQGNFGSIDGDPPAAMRYTESRLDRIAKHMLDDINKNTVDFQPNFDDSENEPSVLPARLPNLLLNGSDGIAVGMATRIPPHNLTEVAGAVNLHVDTILESGTDEKPSISIEEYMQHVKGPDFPTGASIHGIDGIADMYATGKGRFHVRQVRGVRRRQRQAHRGSRNSLPGQESRHARPNCRFGEQGSCHRYPRHTRRVLQRGHPCRD